MICPDLSELPPPLFGLKGWPWTEQSVRLPERMPDGAPWPRISVVIPSFNQRQFLEPAIRSVLLQGYPDIELIVMDGGSTDGSVDILRKYEQWFAYWVSEWDAGQSNAVNKGIDKSTGEMLFWLNSDDLAMPDAFGKAARAFKGPSRPRLVVGDAAEVDEAGNVTERWEHHFPSYEEFALHLCTIRQVSTFFDRRLFDEYGGLNVSLHYCMDREILLKITKDNPPLLVHELFAAYRAHGAAKTQKNVVASHRECNEMSLRFIQDSPRLAEFYDKRAASLLDRADKPGLPMTERFGCLIEAVKLQPRLLHSWRLIGRTFAVIGATLGGLVEE
jgi:glycosyltransferase involved in cell wall biosynthesis